MMAPAAGSSAEAARKQCPSSEKTPGSRFPNNSNRKNRSYQHARAAKKKGTRCSTPRLELQVEGSYPFLEASVISLYAASSKGGAAGTEPAMPRRNRSVPRRTCEARLLVQVRVVGPTVQCQEVRGFQVARPKCFGQEKIGIMACFPPILPCANWRTVSPENQKKLMVTQRRTF
jgi:hypothetical protein